MEGSTDKGLFGFGHKHEEKTQTGEHGSGAQQQPFKTEHGYTEHHGTTGSTPSTQTSTQSYSAAPGVPPESTQSHGESNKPGLMQKVEHTLGVDKLKEKKAGHKKSGSSSSSSDEEEGGKKKHSIL